MKTAISLPDELFEEADRLARRLKRSRSRVYADAIREYVARHDSESVTAGLNRVYVAPDASRDPVISAAAERLLQRVDW
jgi:metal-responsive CopG/Arc/MetJ family transcriptional regulator